MSSPSESAHPAPRLLSTREAADTLGCSVSWLAKARCLRADGPRFVRLGGSRKIAYDPQDLADFVARHKHSTTAEYVFASKHLDR